MLKARKFVVKKHFQGLPKRDDYELVEYELPAVREGEFLVKAEWISVDPYLRAYNLANTVPYDQFGFQVGTIIESKNVDYPPGTIVFSHKGWRDYTIMSNLDEEFARVVQLSDLKGLPLELSIGAVGMPGITAYFGFLEICQPESGETVVVTGAAGAVGSIVGQIARIKGCRVIGIVGSDKKVQWLEQELGFDKAINYKTEDIEQALRLAARNGVDCFFDNVGGEISSIVISQMNRYGRVSVCGSISAYNEGPAKMPKATVLQPSIVFKELKIEGFIVSRWMEPKNRWPEAISQLVEWIKNGQIKAKCHVTEGFEKLTDAFIGILNGDNIGKAVVKVT